LIEATLLKTQPTLKPNKKSKPKVLGLKESKVCKEALSILEIKNAISKLGLEYKTINEVDIYNIIEYILSNKE